MTARLDAYFHMLKGLESGVITADTYDEATKFANKYCLLWPLVEIVDIYTIGKRYYVILKRQDAVQEKETEPGPDPIGLPNT